MFSIVGVSTWNGGMHHFCLPESENASQVLEVLDPIDYPACNRIEQRGRVCEAGHVCTELVTAMRGFNSFDSMEAAQDATTMI